MRTAEDIHVTRLVVGELATNCYVLTAAGEEAAVVIDPGGEAEKIISCCEKHSARPDRVVLTHAHCDHLLAAGALKGRCPGAELSVGRADAEMLTDEVANLSAMLGCAGDIGRADRLLSEGDEVAAGTTTLRVLETPGHTPGGISLLLDGEPPTLFCDDLLFAGDVGRTDLPGGSHETLLRSIREKVMSLPDDTIIRPGHGPQTTVGRERVENPFVS